MKCARTRCDCNVFGRIYLEAQRVAVERQGVVQIGYRNADVIESRTHRLSLRCRDPASVESGDPKASDAHSDRSHEFLILDP